MVNFVNLTQTLCSNLDINYSFNAAFEYLQEIIPAHQGYLGFFDADASAFRCVASAKKNSKLSSIPEYVPLPANIFSRAIDYWKPNLMNPSDADPVCKATNPFFNNIGCTDLVLPLSVGLKKVGLLIFRSDAYKLTKEHLKLINNTEGIFSLTLSYNLAISGNNRHVFRYNNSLSNGLIGQTTGLSRVMNLVRRVAVTNSTVIIIGETGTGKELIANSIHKLSSRSSGPLIKLNCGAIPENLIDDEFFGHEKGAFTGATSIKKGRFELANGGTLFLDEIGELPLSSQVRLLRVLQDKVIYRVGGEKPIPIDVRIVAATHRDLKKMVIRGEFRQDLWFRLNVFPILVPPLRERTIDIPELVQFFIRKKAGELGIVKQPSVTQDTLKYLSCYHWPGNVRELENQVERALVLHHNGPLELNVFQPEYSDDIATISQSNSVQSSPIPTTGIESSNIQESVLPKLDVAMVTYINKALKVAQGKINGKNGAAAILGLPPNTLRARMRKLGMSLGNRRTNDYV
jgi:transcriptional regulator with GAF, ATPase, and Fis domain